MGNTIRYITSLYLMFFALNLSAQSSFDTDSTKIYIDKAEVLLIENKPHEALKNIKVAHRHAQYTYDDKNLSKIYNIIGYIYEINRQDNKAIENYKSALVHASSSKSDILKSEISNRLGNLYLKSTKDNIKNKGFELNKNSYTIAKKLKDTIRMIRPLLSLAECYLYNEDIKKPYDDYLSYIRAIKDGKMPSLEKIQLNKMLAKYFLQISIYDRANEYINIAQRYLLKEIDNKRNNEQLIAAYYKEQVDVYKIKSTIASGQEDYKAAYTWSKKHNESFVKSQDLDKALELQRATLEFEVDQLKDKAKQVDNVIDKNESQEIKFQISIILGIVIILISLAFLISAYKNNLHKKKLNNVLIEKNKELITAKETAEQVSTLKSQFISTVSHELRTPLYGVIGLTSLLMEDPEEKKKKEYLNSLKFSGDYLLALINDVLQLSKIETNEVKLEKVSFDLKSLIEGIVNSLRSKQKKNNNTVHVEIDKKINTTLLGDSVRLSQILINLIGNSLKFTKNGNIWITVNCIEFENKNYKLNFSIKDDGIGIPESKQATIFDNFAQVKNETVEYEGTGLGLSIVRKLIHLHNSEIYIKSEENKGSEFSFELTYEKAVKQKYELSDIRKTFSVGTTIFNILIVDDNKINQIVTQNILKKKGHTCDLASNGLDAIDMAKANSYDLILMDINMPEMNGLDATKGIRVFNSEIPIIALTAVEEGEIRDQAMSVGMNDVIIKPYDTQQFFQTIMKNISKVNYN